MKRETFDRAFEQISDGLVQDALNVYDKKRNRRKVWVRVAAVAATVAIVLTATLWPRQTPDGEIITAPGILKVYAYDATEATSFEEMKPYEITDGVDVSVNDKYLPYWSPYMNKVTMIPYTLRIEESYYEGKAITFDISVNCGRFYLDRGSVELGQKFTVQNGTVIHWKGSAHWKMEEAIAADGGIFAQIIIRADNEIVGCGVIKMKYDTEQSMPVCYPNRCDAVCYPMVEGRLQNVSEEYALRQIEEFKVK